jgi:hypothetical protein
MAPWFGWLTCLNPAGADPRVVRPVQVALVQVVPVLVARVLHLQPRVPKAHVQAQALVQAQWGNAQGALASLVKLLARAPTWLDRTLA